MRGLAVSARLRYVPRRSCAGLQRRRSHGPGPRLLDGVRLACLTKRWARRRQIARTGAVLRATARQIWRGVEQLPSEHRRRGNGRRWLGRVRCRRNGKSLRRVGDRPGLHPFGCITRCRHRIGARHRSENATSRRYRHVHGPASIRCRRGAGVGSAWIPLERESEGCVGCAVRLSDREDSGRRIAGRDGHMYGPVERRVPTAIRTPCTADMNRCASGPVRRCDRERGCGGGTRSRSEPRRGDANRR
jgi:hypothetical protein